LSPFWPSASPTRWWLSYLWCIFQRVSLNYKWQT
jgi:hypothetical protein